MNIEIHALWNVPPDDAPEIQKQAYRLMMQTLKKIHARAPDVLSAPGRAGGGRVIDAAIAAMLSPKLNPVLRLAALTMLQKRMASVDPQTPKRLFLIRPRHQSAISLSFGSDLHVLAAFDQALETFILEKRPGTALHTHSWSDSIDPLQAVGLLLALLVLRLGHGSLTLLAKAVEAIDRKPWMAGCWAWIDLDLSQSTNSTMQMRRLFLDPTTLAAWLLAAERFEQLPKPNKGLKAGKRAAFYRRIARNAFKALAKPLQPVGHTHITKLDQLCRCQIQRLRMATIPVLATYAQGEIVSSSLEIGTWLRLIDHDHPKSEHSRVITDPGAEMETLPLSGIDPGAEGQLEEQLAVGDLEEDGLIQQLRALMSGSRDSWDRGFASIIADLEVKEPENETARWAVKWLQYLASHRCNEKKKPKPLSDGSIRHYRGLLVNRLIRILPPNLQKIDEDQLLDAYLDVIMSRRSLEQTNRIRAALVSFDRYLRRADNLPDLPPVTLPGFKGAAYAISSRIIVEPEFHRGLELTRNGSIAFDNELLADQTRAFWILAFRFGLRRTEILGLQRKDLSTDLIRIRHNRGRGLKTSNAHRVVPLSALNHDERYLVLKIAQDKSPQHYLFFGTIVPNRTDFESHLAIKQVKDLLVRVSGDWRLHPHNLRHSSATLILLGTLGHDLGIESHPYATRWMKECLKTATAIEQAISGQLHRKAARGSALALLEGHGSELTTYEHYVHCFDLLLFLACWSGRFDPVKREATRRLSPPRQETGQLLAMLGYAPTTRIETHNPEMLLQRIGKLCPTRIEKLPRHTPRVDSIQTTKMPDPGTIPIELKTLLHLPGAHTWRGCPVNQGDLDTAALLLRKVNCARLEMPQRLESVIHRWLDHQLTNDDWASMPTEIARI